MFRYWLGNTALPLYDFDRLGAGAVFISAHDLVRFGMFHLHGRRDGQQKTILKPGMQASMRDAPKLNDGSLAGYGIGWFIGKKHGLKYFGHNGGMAGVAAVLTIYPECSARERSVALWRSPLS